jgi:AraC-like DNA-binding protein/mannose-6-phosphate isomerase-like protein (cupin superfamily)
MDGGFDARAGCVTVLAYEYPNGYRVPRHVHRTHQLLYAVAGAMAVHTDKGSFIVPPTRAVWVPRDLPHALDMSGTVSMRTLFLSPSLWKRAPKHCRVVAVSPLLRALIMTAIDRRGLDRRRARDARLIGVLIDQLAGEAPLALHLPTLADARAARVAQRVRAQPGERRPLSELAQGTGASPRTIERLFRAELGMSFGQWRKQARLVYALQRLAAGESVTSAAFESGYAGVSAFIAAFRKTFGVTPGASFRAAPEAKRSARRHQRR